MTYDAAFAAMHDAWLNPPREMDHMRDCPLHENNDGMGDCDCIARAEALRDEQFEDARRGL